MEYYSTIKKKRILNICCNMDGTGGDNAKCNKSSRERQLYEFTCMWNLRNKTEEHRGKNKTRQNQRGRQTIRDS